MKLSKRKGLLILTSAVLVAVSFFLPMWAINLKAPFIEKPLLVEVYPLAGVVGDLQNVNIVNHYVGLGRIDPASMPELVYLKFVYALLLVFSVAAAALNGSGKRFYLVWGIYIVILLGIPIYAYLWMYDYTHTINPEAPIKVEPFDPPFFGVYRIANFDITSYLGPGFFLPLAAAILQIFTALRWRRSEGR